MEMDWKTNMAELGGAFMVSWLVLGEMGDDGNMLMAGLLLAVTMAAMAEHTFCQCSPGSVQ